jgi:hypothetical protein
MLGDGTIKELKGKRSMVVKDVKSVGEAVFVLRQIYGEV